MRIASATLDLPEPFGPTRRVSLRSSRSWSCAPIPFVEILIRHLRKQSHHRAAPLGRGAALRGDSAYFLSKRPPFFSEEGGLVPLGCFSAWCFAISAASSV